MCWQRPQKNPRVNGDGGRNFEFINLPRKMLRHWIVTDADKGKRLDVFLKDRIPAQSRSFLQLGIRKGEVLVNHEPKTPAWCLKVGDRITVEESSGTSQMALRPQPELPIVILEERDAFVVIAKPSGISTHPVKMSGIGSVANWVVGRYP